MVRNRRRAAWVALFVVVLFDQGLHWGPLRDGTFLGRRVVPFDPPVFFDRQEAWVEDLRRHGKTGRPPVEYFGFDPDLGWCPSPNSGSGSIHFDGSAARVGIVPLPSQKSVGVRRVVVVGCSFTRGDEVEDHEAWPALLDRDAEELELVNLGVGAYGIDQAILRMDRDAWSFEPDEVWLGLMPYATSRVLTQFRPSLQHWSSTPAFKPRFILGEAETLRLIPQPAGSPQELLGLLTDSGRFLRAVEHDRYVGAHPSAWLPAGEHWSHRSGLARVLSTYFESKKQDCRRSLLDPSSELFRVVSAICRRGRSLASARGVGFRVLVLPSRRDLRWLQEDGQSSWSTLFDALGIDGIEVIDLTEALLEAGALERPEFWMPGVHYSPLGNRVVAKALAEAVLGD